jgi:hypothetical protein
MNKDIDKLVKEKSGIRLDIGCGQNKQPGFVGIDYTAYPGVDIVWNVEQFPWPLKDESVLAAVSSHLVEHLNPHSDDARLAPLIRLLLKKKLITQKEITEYIGEISPGPIFMRFMDEVWRVLKYDGEFGIGCPYATSHGMHQDPTHVNFINETTWAYFDPLHESRLYTIYKPKPWKIKFSAHQRNGNMEVVLIKRRLDPSYLQ